MAERRLLVVEDDRSVAEMVCGIAAEVGFAARSAHGYRALTVACGQHVKPDVVVLDILMPEMDGIEVLQFLDFQLSEARIVILSGSGEASRAIIGNFGKALGFTIEANIEKPFHPDELKAVLGTIKNRLEEERKSA